jgi:hypothetical protein
VSPDIPEGDWKVFRQLREVALERFCERVLQEIGKAVSATAGKSHDRYLEIYRLVEQRDIQLGNAFDAPRRSQAIMQISAIHTLGLLTPDELARFSEATQDRVKSLSGLVHGRDPKR